MKIHVALGETRRFTAESISKCFINVENDFGDINLDRFDSFLFILKNGYLERLTDIVYYGNLSDKRNIARETEDEKIVQADIEINFKLEKLEVSTEKIEVFLSFVYLHNEERFGDENKNVIKKYLNVQFILLDRKETRIIECEIKTLPVNTLKLFELIKIDNETYEILTFSISIAENLEKLIEERLIKENG